MRVAAVQLCSKNDKKKNLANAQSLMTRAVHKGAKLIALPEYFSFMGARSELVKEAEEPRKGPAYEMLQTFASKNQVYVLGGSIPTKPAKSQTDKRLLNRSTFFGPNGKELAHYDKMHLFDASLAKASSESKVFQPGSELKVARAPFGKVGFAICYDLRFPELFRALTFKGAKVICVPSAFLVHTGKAHWLSLLKARAIENQVFIVAPAQAGKHSESKSSFGKSCIIDPWGKIIAQAPNRESVVLAELDFKFLTKVRKELPVLKHYQKDIFHF